MKRKKISILGCTGSIGRNTLQVIKSHPERFEVFALCANRSIDVLKDQIREFHPKLVVVVDDEAYENLVKDSNDSITYLSGEEGLLEAVSEGCVDFVMAGIVGAAGLPPFIKALENGKTIGLANKEVLVMAGEWLHQRFGEQFLEQIIPVDSEHSAIFQCILSGKGEEIEKISLTASGGPFRKRMNLENLTVDEALKHPNWKMGPKVTIDSATLMNKGLELIEAYWLFPVQCDQIEVVIHPQSIIHSMVTFQDGSTVAHLGVPDMRIPIQYALAYPDRLPNQLERLDFFSLQNLSFEKPDIERFPCLNLARVALQKGGVYPAVLNAANEVSVQNFLNGKIQFLDIGRCNAYVLEVHKEESLLDLKSLLNADRIARKEASDWISRQS